MEERNRDQDLEIKIRGSQPEERCDCLKITSNALLKDLMLINA